MSRYIDADALTERIRHFVDTMSVCPSTDYCSGLRFMKKQAIEAVENAPTVDAVPVKWIQSYVKRLEDNGNTFAAAQYEMMIDDYRADGERRSE